MNKYTLRFNNQNLEQQYFADQFNELFKFYTWACIIGTISAIGVFCMEFFQPFGFGLLKYGLGLIPISFYISHKIVRKYPDLFNIILACTNFLLGVMIYFLLFVFANSNVLFLAGQTVAMVQYSLLLGSNIIANFGILLLNQIGLMIMCTYVQEFFNSIQIMFILALLLVLKSLWIQEKTKRMFFLLKTEDTQLQQSLDNVFKFKIVQCSFNEQINAFQLLHVNKQATKLIKNQEDFTYFIRNYKVVSFQHQNTLNEESDQTLSALAQLKQTLEQVLFKLIKDKVSERSAEISSDKFKQIYKVSLQNCLNNGNPRLIILLQEDTQCKKMIQLKKKNSRYKFLNHHLSNCFDYSRLSLGYLKSLLNQQSLINKNQQLILKKSIQFLYKTIFGYYNMKLFIGTTKFGEMKQFHFSLLFSDIQSMWGIYDPKQEIEIYFKESQTQCYTNYAMILQLILNVIVINISQLDCQKIFINAIQKQVEGIQVISCLITFKTEFNQFRQYQTREQRYLNIILEKVNKKILQEICLTQVMCKINNKNDRIIEFNVIQNLNEFKLNLEHTYQLNTIMNI
ncbi:unnamed protein product [Paramecium primaurelia]|uniref:Transmembrane protein n=1 Tax=Paramecium primaurelia TaxID=5886 RepID=A0A8S1LSU5_PARPR|nr:unnamed protein product [Paramecium primaurelia]